MTSRSQPPIRLPTQISRRFGFGVDLPWEVSAKKLVPFIDRYHHDFDCFFFSYQPRSRNRLNASEYFPEYDAVVDLVRGKTLSFHHTILNLGSTDNEPKDKIIQFTNELLRRYPIGWINEDLGIWSVMGHKLPYPLPPYLTREGLEASIRNTLDYQRALDVPLCVEFPGFTEGSSFSIGGMDAFRYYRELIERTGSPATLDTGHILSYQWLRGNQSRFLQGLEDLPYGHCFEIHLSGCQIVNGKFMDFHHGILLDEQLELLEFLIDQCPNLKVITYEDPKFTADGRLIEKSVPNYERLRRIAHEFTNSVSLAV